MIEMTSSARQRFDEYFRRLRTSLRGMSPAEADDVEQSVREHIEVALAATPAPVGGEQLAAVLDRLGAPDGWVPPDERSIAQRLVERLRTGPEEWRLAYVAFGLFLVSLILLPVGLGFLLMIASFLVSRACADYMEARQIDAGGRQWLIYPPIGFFLALATILFVIGLAGPVLVWGVDDHGFLRAMDEFRLSAPYYDEQFVFGAAAVTLGVWWVMASLLAMVFLPLIRFIFKPLLSRVRRTHFLGLTAIGTVAISIGYLLLRPWIQHLW